MKTCPECNSTYKGKKKQVYCSKSCRGAAEKRKNRVLFNCNNCGKVSEMILSRYKRSKRHYCSQGCKNAHQTIINKGDKNSNFKDATTLVECSNCGKVKKILDCTFKNSCGKMKDNHYCSQSCKAEHQTEILSGENNPNFQGGPVITECDNCKKTIDVPVNRLKSRVNIYCSLSCKYRHNGTLYRGVNSARYIHGLSHTHRERYRIVDGYNEWRKAVYKRDLYTCQLCNSPSRSDLNAHHLDGYNWAIDKRTVVSNGITLCSDCHKNFHRIYGNGNNTKEQFEQYKNNLKTFA